MDPDPDPTPDPSPLFIDCKDAKKNYLFFLINCPQLPHLQSKKCLLIFVLKFYFAGIRPLNTILRKGKDPDPDLDMNPDLGGPKTCGSCRSGSGIGSGSPTLRMTPPQSPLNDEKCQEDCTKKFRNFIKIILILQIRKAENRLKLEKLQLKNYLLHHG
jgi:hypothetical protein